MSVIRPLLEARGINRCFGGLKAVQDVSIEIAEGSITALIGPNGAGKTTFFNTVSMLIPPDSGSIRYHGAGEALELTRLAPHRIARAGVARTFQNIRLFTGLSVLDNVKAGLHARTRAGLMAALFGSGEEQRIAAAALRYLAFVGLLEKAHTSAISLAYGERRKLEIARALAAGPKLLLLDEPAAGMNPQETDALMDLIRLIRDSGVTVFLIEHDMKLVMRASDHIYVMDHGELIAAGPPAAIRRDARVIEAYLGPGHGEAG